MLYHLLYPLVKLHPAFNVVRYITFRAAAATLTALILGFIVGPYIIRKLEELKVGQVIRDDGPASHHQKAGTPTMGGVLILFSLFFSVLLWGNLNNKFVWMALLSTMWMGLIGFLDDYRKLKGNSYKGLGGRYKMLAQIVLGLGVGVYLYFYPIDDNTTKLAIPFFKRWLPDLGIFYIPFVAFVIVGTSNAVNLTDGLDGLAIGPIIMSSMAFTILAYIAGHAEISRYLLVLNVKGSGELTIFCAAMVGAGVVFLWFNTFPAQVFMGDIGSLSLGAALALVAIITKNELVLVIVGGVFVLETVSVILQVISFQTSGKRIFLMSPLHHHFELKGWVEPKIIVRFWIISFILAIVSLLTLKLR